MTREQLFAMRQQVSVRQVNRDVYYSTLDSLRQRAAKHRNKGLTLQRTAEELGFDEPNDALRTVWAELDAPKFSYEEYKQRIGGHGVGEDEFNRKQFADKYHLLSELARSRTGLPPSHLPDRWIRHKGYARYLLDKLVEEGKAKYLGDGKYGAVI